MNFENIGPNIFNCLTCPVKCDGVSKGVYIFENDVTFSERYEQLIIDTINATGKYKTHKCELEGYPDIEITDLSDNVVSYLEVKAQQRTFMAVERILPFGDLKPSETLALNLSDLLRYFEIKENVGVPVFLIWVLKNRPCIVDNGKVKFFMQNAESLQKVYEHYGNKRRFRRESGRGDIVNGQHKGVVVNYHFSLNELIEVDIESKEFLQILVPKKS